MSLRPELEFAKVLLPHRSINFAPTNEGENTMTTTEKSLLLRLAEHREERLHTRGVWPKRAATIGIIGALTAGGGVAFATWTATASGGAAAGAGTLQLKNVVAGSTTSATLMFPGAAAGTTSGATAGGDLMVKVDNPQNFSVKITSVTQAGPVTVSGGQSTCTSDTGSNGANAGNITAFGTSGVWIGGTKPTIATPSVYTTYSIPSASQPSVNANATASLVPLPNVVSMNTSSDNGCQGATFSIPVTLGISQ